MELCHHRPNNIGGKNTCCWVAFLFYRGQVGRIGILAFNSDELELGPAPHSAAGARVAFQCHRALGFIPYIRISANSCHLQRSEQLDSK
jgi:hypothetical protein